MLILGIESSCDETAAAVARDGREILSSIIASQIELHRPFGGVVPELASREHLENIGPVVDAALEQAAVDIKRIDAIAVTRGPGLIGALHVGVSYAKALAYGLGVPFVGVNHIEGHVFSVVFENPKIEFPALALIVSGGHTNLFHIPEAGRYRVVSRTRDDAAGEAFDKVAKMLGLGYPGGPVIDRLAAEGDPSAVKFTTPKISDGRPDFSFSGIKTAVAKHVRENGIEPLSNLDNTSKAVIDLCASFQFAAVKMLITGTEKAAKYLRPKTLIVAGGVACNSTLRAEIDKLGGRLGCAVHFPSPHLSTDNAAMIAAAGFHHLRNGERAGLDMSADITMRLQNLGETTEDLRARKVRYRI